MPAPKKKVRAKKPMTKVLTDFPGQGKPFSGIDAQGPTKPGPTMKPMLRKASGRKR